MVTTHYTGFFKDYVGSLVKATRLHTRSLDCGSYEPVFFDSGLVSVVI